MDLTLNLQQIRRLIHEKRAQFINMKRNMTFLAFLVHFPGGRY